MDVFCAERMHHDVENVVLLDEGGDHEDDDDKRYPGEPPAQLSQMPHDGHALVALSPPGKYSPRRTAQKEIRANSGQSSRVRAQNGPQRDVLREQTGFVIVHCGPMAAVARRPDICAETIPARGIRLVNPTIDLVIQFAIMFAIGAAMAIAFVSISHLLSPSSTNPNKGLAYECGVLPVARRPRAVQRALLRGRRALRAVRPRSRVHLSLGHHARASWVRRPSWRCSCSSPSSSWATSTHGRRALSNGNERLPASAAPSDAEVRDTLEEAAGAKGGAARCRRRLRRRGHGRPGAAARAASPCRCRSRRSSGWGAATRSGPCCSDSPVAPSR